MTEHPEPTSIARPKPTATWWIDARANSPARNDDIEVSRYRDARAGETVAVTKKGGHETIRMTPAVAARVAAAIEAASKWEDPEVDYA